MQSVASVKPLLHLMGGSIRHLEGSEVFIELSDGGEDYLEALERIGPGALLEVLRVLGGTDVTSARAAYWALEPGLFTTRRLRLS